MKREDAKSVLARNTVWSVVGYGVQFAIPVVLIPYIVSRVTEEIYGGVWVTLFTLAAWLSYFDLGLWGALTREVADRKARHDLEGLRRLWATWFYWDVVVGAALVAGAVVAAPLIVRHYLHAPDPGEATAILVGLSVTFVLAPPMRHLTCTLSGLQRLDLTNLIAIVITPLWAIGQVVALELGWGLRGLMLNGVFFAVVQVVVLAILVGLQGYPMEFSIRRFSAAEFRSLLGFGWKLQVGYFVNQAFRNDRLVVSQIQASGTRVATYQFGAGIMDRLSAAVAVLSTGVLPAVSDLVARGDLDRVRIVFLRGTKYHALAAVGLLGFAALFGNELMVFWMGKPLPDSVRVLRIMAIGGIATAIGSCGQSIAVALGRPGWTAVASVTGLAATVILYMILGRRYDVIGLATSVSSGLALIQIVFMIGLRRFLDFRWREYVGNAVLKPAVLAAPLVGLYAGWSALAPHLPAADTRGRAFLVLAPAFLLSTAGGWIAARIARVVDEVDLDVLKSSGRRASA